MLKRQRPLSPPPGPSSSTPFFADSPVDLIERDSKRRRTAAPVLDGRARGWATQPQAHDEDEECAFSDDEPDHGAPNPNLQQTEEYKSTNTMLRELHTLHQHRLLFASPPATQAPSVLPPPNAASDKRHLPLQGGHFRSGSSFLSQSPEKGNQAAQIPLAEATRVAEVYEGINRLLGSLFLSRRRKLDPSDEIPGT